MDVDEGVVGGRTRCERQGWRTRVLLPVWMLLAVAMTVALNPVQAHPFLQNRWQVVAVSNRLAMRATVTLREVAVIQGLKPTQLLHPASVILALSNHAAYVSEHLHVFARGARLPIEVLDYTLLAGEAGTGTDDEAPERRHAAYDLAAEIPPAPGPVLLRFAHDVLKGLSFAPGIPWDVSHVLAVTDPLRRVLGEGVVRVGQDVEVTLAAMANERAPEPSPGAPASSAGAGVPAAAPASAPPSSPGVSLMDAPADAAPTVSGFVGFLRHGLHHVASGYDHLMFLAALTLAAKSWRRLLAIIGVFTVAHSITVTLSAVGWLSMPSWIVEPVIAGSIVVVGLENLLAPGHAKGLGRMLVAFGFGLIHGIGFAGGLADGLGKASGLGLAVPIVAFSLGVELGHLAFGAPMFGILKALERHVGTDPTSGSPSLPGRLSAQIYLWGSLLVSAGGAWYLWAALRNA